MKNLAYSIFIVFALYSCSSVNITTSEIFDNEENSWTYIYNNESKPDTISVKILKQHNSSGMGHLMLSNFPFLGYSSEIRVSYYNDGAHTVNGIKFYPPYNNIKNGYKWESGGYNFSLVNTNEEIMINKKLYSNCLHISFSNSITYAGEMWVKEGVGIVKWSFIRTNPPSTEVDYYLLDEQN